MDEFRALTSSDGYYEDFPPGRRIRHARGATIDEVENNYITKQVMNTAQGHWNEAITAGSEFGDGRVVFGLVTGSVVVGLCSQDTAENALAELGLTELRFTKSVHHGDTLYAYSEVLKQEPTAEHPLRRALSRFSIGASISTETSCASYGEPFSSSEDHFGPVVPDLTSAKWGN